MIHNKETIKAAEEYANSKSIFEVFREAHIEDFLAGDEHGAARKQKEVDELVEAFKELYDAIDCCTDLTPELLNKCNTVIKKHQR